MRRVLIFAVVAVALFGVLAPPVQAQAPAPKVTITGLFDQITSTGANHFDGNFARTSDHEWYARTRFRPDFKFEVGRTKAVLGLEIDLMYGDAASRKPATNGALDLNTDVPGVIEIKWIYTEFDLTGKDSLMPFIPVQTVARAGGQPFSTLANYKTTYANGDFAGISMRSTFSPEVHTTFAYVMVQDEIAGTSRNKTTPGDDFAIIGSLELTPFKGFDIKPMYSWFHAEGTTDGNARRTAVDRNLAGGTTVASATYASNRYANGDPGHKENRHTVGVDMRWRSGPFGFDPTILYQFGWRDVESVNDGRSEADMAAWLIDVIGSFQAGPFLLEARGIYSTGNKARDNLSKSIRYFEPLDEDTSYYAGWAQLFALGVDYFNGGGGTNSSMANHVGYDRYGRLQFGVRGTYSLTPALKFYAVLSPTWTAEKVDTDTGQAAGNRTTINDKSWVEGDSRYLGTEGDIGMTWRFAPNTAFDLVGAYLFAGDALDVTENLAVQGPTKRDAKDAWTVQSRVRLAF